MRIEEGTRLVAEYKPNTAATGQWLRSSSELQQAVTAIAEMIAARARSTAPVETGEYRNRISVRTSRAENGRVAADVEANAPHSIWVEIRHQTLRAARDSI
jgi:hypothetical protein